MKLLKPRLIKAAASSGGSAVPAPKVENSPSNQKVDVPTPATSPPAPDTPGKVVATPYAKKLAKQHKVD